MRDHSKKITITTKDALKIEKQDIVSVKIKKQKVDELYNFNNKNSKKSNYVKYKYYLINKPFQVLSQFTREGGKECLKDYFEVESDIYTVGRLDYDSEGLLILTNDNYLKTNVLAPDSKTSKVYLVQVENTPTIEDLEQLENGVTINVSGKEYQTQKCKVFLLSPEKIEKIEERVPPIRFRKSIPTTWLEIHITEGKNRQIRKMTAKINCPTLRIIRHSIGNLNLNMLEGKSKIEISQEEIYKLLNLKIVNKFSKTKERKALQNKLYNERITKIKNEELNKLKSRSKSNKKTSSNTITNAKTNTNKSNPIVDKIEYAYKTKSKRK